VLLYEKQVRNHIRKIREYAVDIRGRFECGRPARELLRDAEHLRHLVEELVVMLPKEVSDESTGSLHRHQAWLVRRLREGDPEACRSDIEDICARDLDAIEEEFVNWTTARFDEELAEKVTTLLARREWDSAIRKAFVVLKSRLVKRFGAKKDIDGTDLVNSIFGKESAVTGLVGPERQAWRDLLAGLYGVYRNKYGHEDAEAPWHEVDAVLAMVNAVLLALDEMSGRGKPEKKKRPPA
jgi:hypothetical protein